MIRRRFLGLISAAGASSVAGLAALKRVDRRTAAYKVEGFTCITCAVGLETMLLREKGVLSVKATYPEGRAVVVFDPAVVSEGAISELIAGMGFLPHLSPQSEF